MTLRQVLTLLFRISWFSILVFTFFEQSRVNQIIPVEYNRTLKFGGRYVFLTHLNQLATKFAFVMLILSNFNIVSNAKSSVLWSSTSLPLSFIVTVLYWALYSINPDLVRKKEVTEFIPFHLDFILHTAIMPATIIEGILGGHTITVRKNFKYVSMMAGAYAIWLLICFNVTGDWPYGFVAKMGVIPAALLLIPAFLLIAIMGMGITKQVASISPVDMETSVREINQNGISLKSE